MVVPGWIVGGPGSVLAIQLVAGGRAHLESVMTGEPTSRIRLPPRRWRSGRALMPQQRDAVARVLERRARIVAGAVPGQRKASRFELLRVATAAKTLGSIPPQEADRKKRASAEGRQS
jgi:hypothetical protein